MNLVNKERISNFQTRKAIFLSSVISVIICQNVKMKTNEKQISFYKAIPNHLLCKDFILSPKEIILKNVTKLRFRFSITQASGFRGIKQTIPQKTVGFVT